MSETDIALLREKFKGDPYLLAIIDGMEASIVSDRIRDAAPDLLQALIEATDMLQSISDSGDCGYWRIEQDADFISWRAAIAKAKGETTSV